MQRRRPYHRFYTRLNLSLLVFVCAGFSASAIAKLPKAYVFLGGGYAEQQEMPAAADFANISGATGSTSSDKQHLGGRIGLGIEWMTSKHTSLGVETAGALYGSTKYSQDNTSLDLNYYGVEFLGVGRLHIGQKLILTGKAGIVDERMHGTQDNLPADSDAWGDAEFDDSNDQILPELAGGFGYQISKHGQLSAMYYHTYGDDVSFDTLSNASNLPSINAFDLEFTYYY